MNQVLWQSDILNTRSTIKGHYPENQYYCPHCEEGKSVGILETPSHLMWCRACKDLRQGKDPGLVLADRAPYLLPEVVRRKELEEQFRRRTKQN